MMIKIHRMYTFQCSFDNSSDPLFRRDSWFSYHVATRKVEFAIGSKRKIREMRTMKTQKTLLLSTKVR